MESEGEAAAAKTCIGKSYPDQHKKDICADASGRVTLDGLTIEASPFSPKSDALGGPALCSDLSVHNISSKSQDYNVLDFKFRPRLATLLPLQR